MKKNIAVLLIGILFLCLTAGKNNLLAVEPIYVPVYLVDAQSRRGKSGRNCDTPLKAWNSAVASWNASEWRDGWFGTDWRSNHVYFGNYLYRTQCVEEPYGADIYASRAKLAINLTYANPDDYLTASLVVMPYKLDTYYNEQGWVENKYNFLKDMIGEFGKNWISAEYYALAYTPSKPVLSYGPRLMGKGYAAGFWIILIPKLPGGKMGSTDDPNLSVAVDPINIINGNMYSIHQDISISAKGLPLEFTRTYNSRDNYNVVSGYGWTHSYNIFLNDKESHIEIKNGEGARYTYVKSGDGTYTAPVGKYGVLVKNAGGSYSLTEKHGTRYNFDSSGKLTSIVDRNNNIQILTYSGDLLSQVADSSGKSLAISYNEDNKISKVSDSVGRTAAYDYDAEGNLTSVTDPNNNTTTYIYEEHNLTTIIDPEGHSSHFTYDTENDRCESFSYDNDINKVTLNYDPENMKTAVTDSKGNTSIYEYNYDGVVTAITDSEGNARSWAWDNNVNRTSSSDENGNAMYFGYDDRGNLTWTADSDNNATTFAHEGSFDMCSSITDTLNQTTTYAYDERGNLIQVENVNGGTTGYTYDPSGNLLSTTDANEHTTRYEYDTSGNLLKVIDPLNNETQFEYDALGNCIKLIDANGNETVYAYDILNRLAQITYQDDSAIKYEYDKADNRTSVTDSLNRTTNYVYDPAGKLLEVTDASQNKTIYTYDTEGNKTSVKDANGNVTTYEYDNLNRLLKTITPSGKETIYTYDAAGNRISMTNAIGNLTTYVYEYDENDRIIRTTYADGKEVIFAYDKLGRRMSMTDAIGTTAYEYDNLNRLTSIIASDSEIISYTYDAVGNRTSMTDQNGEETQYEYDALNRLTSLTAPDGKTTNYSYDSVSNLTNMTLPNNTQVNYQFDNLNKLLNLTNKKNDGEAISSFGYDYNLAGMRNKVTLADGSCIEYEYDDLNRLTKEAKYDARGNLLYSNTYEFDNVGNRLKLTKLVPGDLEEKSFGDDFNRRQLGENWEVKDSRWRIIGRRWLFGWARNKGEVLYNSEDNISNFEAEVDLNRIYLRYKRAQLAGISYQGAETRRIAGVKGELKRYLEKKKVKRTIIIWKWKKVKIWRWTRWVRYPVRKTYWRWKYNWRIEREVSYVLGHYEGATLVEDAVKTEAQRHKGTEAQSKRIKVKIDDGKAELFAKENGEWVKKVEFVYPATEEGKVGLFIHGKRVAYSRFDNFKLVYQIGAPPQEEVINYAYNNENQLLSVDNGQGQALSLQYDDNGNLTRKDDSQGATAYSWDGENRLIGVNYPDGTSDEYVYDGVGKRIQVSEDGVITNYLYDGLNVIIEQNNSGMTTASYVRDLGYSGGIGSIISKQGAGGSKQYYYYDGIGNVVNTADNAGNVTQSFVYDAYGNILNEAVPSPHGFSTKEYSNRSGLIHFGARVYDPMTGRFISKDPIGFSDGMNVYNYCGSDPINWIDPIGLCAKNVVSNSGDTIKTLVLPMMLNFTTIKKFAFKFGKSIAWPKLVSSGTTGSNKFYWPGRKIGGKASKSFRLPIAKSAGNMLGAYAVATDLKVLGENWQAGSRGLQTLHDFAMLGADTAGFFGNSPPTAFLKLIPALARATDYSSNYWGGQIYGD